MPDTSVIIRSGALGFFRAARPMPGAASIHLVSDWSHLSKIVGLNCEVICVNLAGKKARSQWIYSLTTRHCMQLANLYVHILPCLASFKSIKQTWYLKRKCIYSHVRRRRLNLQAWLCLSLSHQAEQAGLASQVSDIPAKPIIVPAGDAGFVCPGRGPVHPHSPQPGCSVLCRTRQQPKPTVWQKVIWAGVGNRATPSRVAEPTSSGGWLSWRTGSQEAEGGVGRGPNAGNWTSPLDTYYYTSHTSESCRSELQLHSDTALCVTKDKDTPTCTQWSPVTCFWTNLGVLVAGLDL